LSGTPGHLLCRRSFARSRRTEVRAFKHERHLS
jgi:hypothetical protein